MILVTGAGGFLGSSLVARLHEAGHDVRAVLRNDDHARLLPPDVETVLGDIRDKPRMEQAAAGCETVIHLAGKAHALDEQGPDQEYFEVNVQGTRNLLECAAVSGAKRLLFISTVKVFGEDTEGCIDETASPAPQTPYGRSKWEAERLVAEYARKVGIKAVSLRLPLVYGPTNKGNLYRMIAAIDRGKFPPLPQLSTRRSMLDAKNFVRAVQAWLERGHFLQPAYIVTDAQPYSTTAIYEQICLGLGKPVPTWRVPLGILKMIAAAGDTVQAITKQETPITSATLNKLVGSACYSPQAFIRETGYRPEHSFNDAVPELIDHYRKCRKTC